MNPEGLDAAAALAARLLDEAAAELKEQGLAGDALNRVARVHVRYQGTDTALPCALPATSESGGVARVRDEFERSYRRRFEFVMPGQALVNSRGQVLMFMPGQYVSGLPAPRFAPVAPGQQVLETFHASDIVVPAGMSTIRNVRTAAPAYLRAFPPRRSCRIARRDAA